MSSAAPVRRRQVFFWGAIFGYGSLAFTLARNVLLVPLYLHYIDLGEYGAWLATGGALVQLLVTDFGLAGVITQRIAAHTGGGNHTAMRALVSAGLANALLLGLAMSALSSLVALWMPATQGLSAPAGLRVRDCFLIAVAANGLGVVGGAALAVVRGAQKPTVAGSIALAADLASVVVTLGCLFAGFGLYGLAWGLFTRSAVSMVAALGVIERIFSDFSGRWWPRWRDSLDMWRDSARFFATSIAMRLQSQANILTIGIFLGPHAAAIYGLTVRAHETVQIIVGQLYASFGPVLAHLAGAGDTRRLMAVIRALLPLAAALAAIGAVCVVVFNQSFVTLWVGPQAFGGWPLTVLMAVAMWLAANAFVSYEALLARGEFALIARAFALSSLVHVTVLAIVLPTLGAWAAPLALCASTTCWGTLLWRRIAADGEPSLGEQRSLFAEASFIGLVAICAAALWILLPQPKSWATLIVAAPLCALTVAVLLLAARPALRRLLSTEIAATLRSLRAA